jgi:hypothetical protein
MEVLLALALGTLAGYLVGGARVTAQVRRGRLVRKAGAALAPLLPETGPARTLADIFANRIRVRLGGITYELPVLPRAANRRWLESLEGQLAATAAAYQAAATDPAQVVPLLLGEAGVSYELLLSYDQAHVLPSIDEIDEIATDAEILRAVMEVWQAANPKAAAERAPGATSTSSPGPSTSSAASTAGAPTTSSVS